MTDKFKKTIQTGGVVKAEAEEINTVLGSVVMFRNDTHVQLEVPTFSEDQSITLLLGDLRKAGYEPHVDRAKSLGDITVIHTNQREFSGIEDVLKKNFVAR